MNISAPFVARPVATTLLMLAVALAGILGFSRLPVAPMPRIDLPTIVVSAQLPGASPNTVATSIAAPLERHLGLIADVTEMTSRSTFGQTTITLQFDISRDIEGAARTSRRPSMPLERTYPQISPSIPPTISLIRPTRRSSI